MDERTYFVYENHDREVMWTEFDAYEYQGLSAHPEDWLIPDRRFTKSDAVEIAEILNALVDDRRGRMVLVKRLFRLL
jgi:hypothetical protein